ncbi:MAG: hypothetical protein PUP92_02950 [Rhizonema sp. PD38]|nr:hypothetical protein [Rhizonema sp. PD38]
MRNFYLLISPRTETGDRHTFGSGRKVSLMPDYKSLFTTQESILKMLLYLNKVSSSTLQNGKNG